MGKDAPEGYEYVIIRAWDGSEYRDVLLDSEGRMVAVFKGQYDTELKTVKLDSEGRIGVEELHLALNVDSLNTVLRALYDSTTTNLTCESGGELKVAVYGWDGTTLRRIKTDTTGELHAKLFAVDPAGLKQALKCDERQNLYTQNANVFPFNDENTNINISAGTSWTDVIIAASNTYHLLSVRLRVQAATGSHNTEFRIKSSERVANLLLWPRPSDMYADFGGTVFDHPIQQLLTYAVDGECIMTFTPRNCTLRFITSGAIIQARNTTNAVTVDARFTATMSYNFPV